ncbi:MAG: M1 family metallopeptidase [archaeon]|nr:M1 family metallopeptidase [archaeon]
MQIGKIIFLLGLSFISSLTDPSSFSNYDQIKQTKLEVNFDVNFEEKIFYVTEKLYLTAVKSGEVIVLDSKAILIDSVMDSNTGEEVPFELDNLNSLTPLGTPLKIYINYKEGDEVILLIKSRTTSGSEAVQFLDKEITEGKIYPYMFTQCESILARTVLPIQDTPAIKLTVAASITVPKPLFAVYAGIYKSKIEKATTTTYFYEQNVPIPSYLIALAAGAIEERIISDRIKIYAEKEVVDKAAVEFSETESFIQAAESYIFDYEWGEYNLLILPSSFPFGGMENPCLTFVTPSIIAGDKSLASVVAHEISHSWSGNLVTMEQWSDFWLNEGFTMFIQRKITQILYGDDRMKISAQGGYRILADEIKETWGETNEFTKLEPNLIGRSPEESFGEVPYEKGYHFLYYLENLVNSNSDRDTFKVILQDYFREYKFKSIRYSDFVFTFVVSLEKHLPEKYQEILNQIDWDTWFYAPGMPKWENDYTNALGKQADDNLELLLKNQLKPETFKPIFDGWHSDVKEYFLKSIMTLPNILTDAQYKVLSEGLGLATGYNADITADFFQVMLKTGKLDKEAELDTFLGTFGRAKYLKALYVGIAKIDKPKAMAMFAKHKAGYHPIAIAAVEQLLKAI